MMGWRGFCRGEGKMFYFDFLLVPPTSPALVNFAWWKQHCGSVISFTLALHTASKSLGWKIQAWTRFNPWPLRYQCSALSVELSAQLGVGCYVGRWQARWWWVSVRLGFQSYSCRNIFFCYYVRSIEKKKLQGSHTLNFVSTRSWNTWLSCINFLSINCLNCVHNCDDHSSLEHLNCLQFRCFFSIVSGKLGKNPRVPN